MSNVMDRIQNTLDPTSVGNALQETMLLWKESDDILSDYVSRGAGRYQTILGERQAYEKVLSAFLGIRRNKVRLMLREHYKEVRNAQS